MSSQPFPEAILARATPPVVTLAGSRKVNTQLSLLLSVEEILEMGKLVSPGLRMLMADDSEEDVFFVKRALDKTGVELFFHAVGDGLAAISYLRAEGEYADREKF